MLRSLNHECGRVETWTTQRAVLIWLLAAKNQSYGWLAGSFVPAVLGSLLIEQFAPSCFFDNGWPWRPGFTVERWPVTGCSAANGGLPPACGLGGPLNVSALDALARFEGCPGAVGPPSHPAAALHLRLRLPVRLDP